MPYADIGDARIHYQRQGKGPPLMLVPGLNGQGTFWSKQLPDLTPHFDVIVHDHRGCGDSTLSLIDYSVAQMADDTLKLMDALGIESASLVGHSTGGAIGQIIAQDHPQRIQRLVLSATWGGPDAYFRRAFELRLQILEHLGLQWFARAGTLATLPPRWIAEHDNAIDERTAGAAARPIGSEAVAVRILSSRIRAILAYDRREQMAQIRHPTLIVCARDDLVTPLHLSEELVLTIPNSSSKFFVHGGHFVPRIDPQAYNPPVLEFLKG